MLAPFFYLFIFFFFFKFMAEQGPLGLRLGTIPPHRGYTSMQRKFWACALLFLRLQNHPVYTGGSQDQKLCARKGVCEVRSDSVASHDCSASWL